MHSCHFDEGKRGKVKGGKGGGQIAPPPLLLHATVWNAPRSSSSSSGNESDQPVREKKRRKGRKGSFLLFPRSLSFSFSSFLTATVGLIDGDVAPAFAHPECRVAQRVGSL